jgi:hypothetical protein
LKGTPSPEFNFENHKGGTTKLSDIKGKYVYIDIWATWWRLAVTRNPIPSENRKKIRGQENCFCQHIDRPKNRIMKNGKPCHNETTGVFSCRQRLEFEFMIKYGVTSIPRFILLGPDGNIVNSNAQRPSDPALQDKLDSTILDCNYIKQLINYFKTNILHIYSNKRNSDGHLLLMRNVKFLSNVTKLLPNVFFM